MESMTYLYLCTKAVKSRRRSRHGFFTGILVGGLLGLVLAGGLATAAMAAGGSMLSRMHGHGWRGSHRAAIHDNEQPGNTPSSWRSGS